MDHTVLSCNACKRLKRKCSRDWPSCTLCNRLGKKCEYSTREPKTGVVPTRLASGTDRSLQSALKGPDQAFPLEFFLDQDLHQPIPRSQLAWSSRQELRHLVSQHVDLEDVAGLFEAYRRRVHAWMPMLSRKRLLDDDPQSCSKTDACYFVLLICMKLCTEPLRGSPGESDTYAAARSICTAAEHAGYVSLRLVQALLLLTYYEMFNALQPNAYLTIARAARLGAIVGLYNSQHESGLFTNVSTWTASEEARRTWWAIFILDRFMNIETSRLPFALPDSDSKELLPVNDDDWDAGKPAASESLYTTSFSQSTIVGPFAMLCQASNLLSKFLQHKRSQSQNLSSESLEEAIRLHRALCALQSSVEATMPPIDESQDGGPVGVAALAVCCTTRLCLYNQYACNSAFGPGPSTSVQTEMQHISLEGITTLVTTTLPNVARSRSECPLLAQCLYLALSEATWFIREGFREGMIPGLNEMLAGLENIRTSWVVADKLLELLRREGTYALVG